MMRKGILTLMLIACTIPLIGVQVTPLFPCSQELDDPYGICSHINRRETDYYVREVDADHICECGANYVRSGLEYSNFVPSKSGTLRPKYIDSMYMTLRAHNLRSLSLVCGSGRQRPLNDTAWYTRYFTYLAKRYTRDVTYWEILNEVNLEKKVSNSADKYASLLRISREVTQAVDSTDKVVFSGVSNVPEAFLRKVAEHDVGAYFDIMNIHSYASPEALPKLLGELRGLMRELGWDKPVWITECGMSTLKDKRNRANWLHTEAEQARRLPRIYLISLSYGVDKVFWYNSRAREADPYGNEEHFGLWHRDMSFKPAAIAYETLTSMCPSGATRPVLNIVNKTYLASWQRPDGTRIWAVWATKPKSVECAIEGEASLCNHLGQPVSIEKANILHIGPELIYIVGADDVKLIKR